MNNPANSILWTKDYFGNGEGQVTSGPAAYWTTDQGSLERDYAKGSTLFKREQLDQVLKQCFLANISMPTARPENDFERYHGGPHVWVGGDMSAFESTGYDPIFYMHHAYVDFIWEKFRRQQQMNCPVNPRYDYPDVPRNSSHHPYEKATGFEWFRNIDGISPHWTNNWYTYAPEPKCPNCCPGCPRPAPLRCHRRKNVCVGRSKFLNRFDRLEIRPEDRFQPAGVFGLTMGPQRNRGRRFQAPPSDGRTVFTAVEDEIRGSPELLEPAPQSQSVPQPDPQPAP